jgi:hypothetical protein
MAPRLKVFVTSDGLTDYVVAVSSKAKALAAWGVRQDVFKEGRAREVADPDLIAAATARPGEVLRRPAGTRGELARLKPPKLKPARPAAPAGPSKAALKKIADLEARLAALEPAHRTAVVALEAQKAAIDRKIERLRERQDTERERLEVALRAARRAPG